MTDCKPPRCFGVKDRCQCPNSWIEYLSKEARERQGKGLPRLSIKRHAANYRKMKRSGKFKTKKPTKECRDINTDTLCQWNSQRRPSIQETSEDMATFLKLKDPSIRDMPGQPEIKTGKFEGIPVIIKVQDIKEVGKENFLYTTKAHMLMTKRIPRSVPQLYKAYFLRSKENGFQGVHIMEHLPGVMMDKYVRRNNCDLPSLARALKKLLDDLKTCKILHKDLGAHNIILNLDHRERVKSAQALDFENTCITETQPVGNADILLEDVFGNPPLIPPALILEMLKTDRNLPRDMKDWKTYGFERRADAARESCVKTYEDVPYLESFNI